MLLLELGIRSLVLLECGDFLGCGVIGILDYLRFFADLLVQCGELILLGLDDCVLSSDLCGQFLVIGWVLEIGNYSTRSPCLAKCLPSKINTRKAKSCYWQARRDWLQENLKLIQSGTSIPSSAWWNFTKLGTNRIKLKSGKRNWMN